MGKLTCILCQVASLNRNDTAKSEMPEMLEHLTMNKDNSAMYTQLSKRTKEAKTRVINALIQTCTVSDKSPNLRKLTALCCKHSLKTVMLQST